MELSKNAVSVIKRKKPTVATTLNIPYAAATGFCGRCEGSLTLCGRIGYIIHDQLLYSTQANTLEMTIYIFCVNAIKATYVALT